MWRPNETTSDKEKYDKAEFRKVARTFAAFVRLCSPAWDEITRMARAFHGGSSSAALAAAVRIDVLQILSAISVANGTVPRSLGWLYRTISHSLIPGEGWKLQDCIDEIAFWSHEGISLPDTL